MSNIHKTAIVSPKALLGNDIEIGSYSIIEDEVKIGNNTKISDYSVIKNGTTIGENCKIGNFVVIGGFPQDQKFDPKIPSGVVVGNNTVLGEHVVVHRAATDGGFTKIGNNCVASSSSHIAHDCEIGDFSILGKDCLCAGGVKLGRNCNIGDNVAIYQDIVIGDYVALFANSETSLHLPSYMISAGPATVVGLNVRALHEIGLLDASVSALKSCVSEFYSRRGFFHNRAKIMLKEGWATTPETRNFLQFFICDISVNSARRFAPMRKRREY